MPRPPVAFKQSIASNQTVAFKQLGAKWLCFSVALSAGLVGACNDEPAAEEPAEEDVEWYSPLYPPGVAPGDLDFIESMWQVRLTKMRRGERYRDRSSSLEDLKFTFTRFNRVYDPELSNKRLVYLYAEQEDASFSEDPVGSRDVSADRVAFTRRRAVSGHGWVSSVLGDILVDAQGDTEGFGTIPERAAIESPELASINVAYFDHSVLVRSRLGEEQATFDFRTGEITGDEEITRGYERLQDYFADSDDAPFLVEVDDRGETAIVGLFADFRTVGITRIRLPPFDGDDDDDGGGGGSGGGGGEGGGGRGGNEGGSGIMEDEPPDPFRPELSPSPPGDPLADAQDAYTEAVDATNEARAERNAILELENCCIPEPTATTPGDYIEPAQDFLKAVFGSAEDIDPPVLPSERAVEEDRLAYFVANELEDDCPDFDVSTPAGRAAFTAYKDKLDALIESLKMEFEPLNAGINRAIGDYNQSSQAAADANEAVLTASILKQTASWLISAAFGGGLSTVLSEAFSDILNSGNAALIEGVTDAAGIDTLVEAVVDRVFASPPFSSAPQGLRDAFANSLKEQFASNPLDVANPAAWVTAATVGAIEQAVIADVQRDIEAYEALLQSLKQNIEQALILLYRVQALLDLRRCVCEKFGAQLFDADAALHQALGEEEGAREVYLQLRNELETNQQDVINALDDWVAEQQGMGFPDLQSVPPDNKPALRNRMEMILQNLGLTFPNKLWRIEVCWDGTNFIYVANGG